MQSQATYSENNKRHTRKARRTSVPLTPSRLHIADQVAASLCWAEDLEGPAQLPWRLAAASFRFEEGVMRTGAPHHHPQDLRMSGQ